MSFGADITVNSTTVNSATQITANITIGANATLGARHVSVTNAAPGGGTATLTNGFTVIGPTIPTAPSNLTAEAISTSEIILRWTDNSNNEDGFRIERRTGVEDVRFFTVGPNVRTYQDRGLNPGTRATYRVFAFNAGGDSPASNAAVEITATGLLGDVVRDFKLDAQDVSLVVDIILQRAAQRITALDLSTADTNFDGKINVIDVVYIVREATRNLLASASLPDRVEENDASGELRLGATTLPAGATAKLPVTISLVEKATALQLKLRYDGEKIAVDDPVLSTAHPGMTLFAARDKDQLAVLIYSLSREDIPAGAYKLLEVPVRTRDTDLEVGLQIENVLLVGEQRKLLSPRVINEAAKLKINLPTAFALSQNYPNPLAASNRQTEIGYTLPVAATVKLSIYNLLGHEVAVLVNAPQTPGVKKVLWDGRDKQGNHATTGIYFYRLTAGNFVATRKMVLK
ncbi:MAG: T9SS type A sorting domain-containing protein [candidate division KSB1 bacterium]|nr:T9SS type A sorting domain-containing protein [candidate division KSB1 bacterium]MDZ7364727.1 T9SS type A sorting domain-containing protein [candidate division KSB1 bacterium]MDZ7402525.1 T9SS type A sorting domain-containing protein [candidate division KSB1 bacterium]